MRSFTLRLRLLVVPAVFLVGVTACGSDFLPITPAATTGAGGTAAAAAACAAVPASSTSDSFNEQVTLTTTADGLKYGDIASGGGATPRKGDKLTVEYTGWLANSTVFDSSRSAGRTPFSFVIGATPPNVIKGWEEGVLTMHVGAKRRLMIPAQLGYGAQVQGTIPANSTLVFDVELLGICPGSPTTAVPSPT